MCPNGDSVDGEGIQVSQCQRCAVAVGTGHVQFLLQLTQNSVVDNEAILVLRERVVPGDNNGCGRGRESMNRLRYSWCCEENGKHEVTHTTQ